MAARSLTRSLARLASPRGAGRIFAPSQSLARLQSTNADDFKDIVEQRAGAEKKRKRALAFYSPRAFFSARAR